MSHVIYFRATKNSYAPFPIHRKVIYNKMKKYGKIKRRIPAVFIYTVKAL